MSKFFTALTILLSAAAVVVASSLLAFAFAKSPEESHAKRDATAAEIDAQTLARIKSIQERIDTIASDSNKLHLSATEAALALSTRIYFLEQRINELENANASGEGEREDSSSGE